MRSKFGVYAWSHFFDPIFSSSYFLYKISIISDENMILMLVLYLLHDWKINLNIDEIQSKRGKKRRRKTIRPFFFLSVKKSTYVPKHTQIMMVRLKEHFCSFCTDVKKQQYNFNNGFFIYRRRLVFFSLS